jgi:ABC-2 type transport system permease protein
MDIILGVFLKGVGWRELWQEAVALLAIGAVLFGLSIVAFRRRIA